MHSSVKQYMKNALPERQERLKMLHDMILKLYPTAVVDMCYKMPTYHMGEGWVSVANQKHYVSLYTCGSHHIEQFKKKYPRINTGKGCIRFKDRDTLPLSDLQAVVKHAMKYPKV